MVGHHAIVASVGWSSHVGIVGIKIDTSFNVHRLPWQWVRWNFWRYYRIYRWFVAADVTVTVLALFTISLSPATLMILGLVVAWIRPFDALSACRTAAITFQLAR